MGRKVTLNLPEGSSVEPQGDTIDGEVLGPGEADAEQIHRENEDDTIRSLTEIEGAQDARWKVFRLLPADKAGFLMEIPSAQLTQAYIAKVAGPGKYRVVGLNPKGRYIGRREFMVAELVHPEAQQVSPFGDIETLRQLFGARPSSFDWDAILKWVAILGPIFGPILLELVKNRSKNNTFTEMAQAAAAMKALMGEAPDPMKQIQSFGAMIAAVKELAPEDKGTGSTWPDIVRDIAGGVTAAIPSIATVLAARRTQGTAPAPGVMEGIPSENVVPQGSATPPTQEQDPMLALIGWLQAQIPGLIVKAAKNSDAAAYAYILLDNLPPGADLAQIHGFLLRPDWWTLFQGMNPTVRPHERWFTEMRDALLVEIEEAVPSLKDVRRASRKPRIVESDDQTPGEGM